MLILEATLHEKEEDTSVRPCLLLLWKADVMDVQEGQQELEGTHDAHHDTQGRPAPGIRHRQATARASGAVAVASTLGRVVQQNVEIDSRCCRCFGVEDFADVIAGYRARVSCSCKYVGESCEKNVEIVTVVVVVVVDGFVDVDAQAMPCTRTSHASVCIMLARTQGRSAVSTPPSHAHTPFNICVRLMFQV